MEELINRAKNGDIDALTNLIYEIKEDLYKIARTRLSQLDDIEDAFQETILEAYDSIKKLRDPKKFKNWIIIILINRCNRIYRKNKKNNISFENLELEEFIRI